MHKKVTEDAFDVTLDGALEGAFVGPIQDATEGSSEDMPNGVLRDLYKNVQEVNLRLKLRVDSAIHGCKGTLECAPNDALSNLHKDAQEEAFEVALGLHLWLHLLMQS